MRRIICFLIVIFYLTGVFLGSSKFVYAQAPDNNPDNQISAGEEIKIFLPLITRSNGESTSLVSIGPDWQLPNKDSQSAALSTDGRYVAFSSQATNLLPGDTNNKEDIFVVDRTLGTIVRASLSSAGAEATGYCNKPSISGDGRFVVFLSSATTLVANDTNGYRDAFLRDLQTNQTSLVSVSTGGAQADANIYNPKISADGNFIVYETSASTLVAGDTNSSTDIFLYDRNLATTRRVSLAANGTQGSDLASYPFISADGYYVAFQTGNNLLPTDTNNLTDAYVRDLLTDELFLVSVTNEGAPANGDSGYPIITTDGRYVVFFSNASNLVIDDTNASYDIFVRDRQASTTQRVSVSSTGAQANGESSSAWIAAGGRYVAFDSSATNLVTSDINAKDDIFLRDLQTNTTTLLSVNTAGAQGNDHSYYPALTPDGRRVVFQSAATNFAVGDLPGDGIFQFGEDIFFRDLITSQTDIVSRLYAPLQSNDHSLKAVVSDDGRYVAFETRSTTLIPTQNTGAYKKIFVRDVLTRQSVLASVSSAGVLSNGDSLAPSLSGDGHLVSFTSDSSALVTGDTNNAQDIFLRNLATNITTRVSVAADGGNGNDLSMQSRLARNGGFICFGSYATNLVSGDTNATQDIFVRDLSTNITERVSVATGGGQANNYSSNCALSADGRFVAFQSNATNLVAGDTNATQDIFVRDRQTGQTRLVSVGFGAAQSNDSSYMPSLSDDGHLVAFHSSATNLVEGDTNGCMDVFVYDLNSGITLRASVSSSGLQGDGTSYTATISGNGQHVVFESIARNLISGDTNNNNDIYTHNLVNGQTVRASLATNGEQGNNASLTPSISANGKYVVFQSAASNLVAGDVNNFSDIFLRDCGFSY